MYAFVKAGPMLRYNISWLNFDCTLMFSVPITMEIEHVTKTVNTLRKYRSIQQENNHTHRFIYAVKNVKN